MGKKGKNESGILGDPSRKGKGGNFGSQTYWAGHPEKKKKGASRPINPERKRVLREKQGVEERTARWKDCGNQEREKKTEVSHLSHKQKRKGGGKSVVVSSVNV